MMQHSKLAVKVIVENLILFKTIVSLKTLDIFGEIILSIAVATFLLTFLSTICD
jgi:hypothetical protein